MFHAMLISQQDIINNHDVTCCDNTIVVLISVNKSRIVVVEQEVVESCHVNTRNNAITWWNSSDGPL